jgi:hypothetical protein
MMLRLPVDHDVNAGRPAGNTVMSRPMSESHPLIIVLIHGVGDAKRGAIVSDFCDALKKIGPVPRFRQENWFIGRFPYARLVGDGVRFAGRELRELIEVNWADVMRPGDGNAGLLRHVVNLFFALRDLSLSPKTNPSAIARLIARIHWSFMDVVGLWGALLTMGAMLLGSVKGGWTSWLVIIGGALLFGFGGELAAKTGRKQYKWGWMAAVLFSAVGIHYVFGLDGNPTLLVKGSALFYTVCQMAVVITLSAAFFSALIFGGGKWAQRIARGSFLWLPFVLGTNLLVLLWLTLVAFAQTLTGYSSWSIIYTAALPYNLWIAEVAMMTAEVFAFVVVPLFGLAAYSFGWGRLLFRDSTRGQIAHHMLEVFLTAAPFALAASLGVILWKGVPANNADNHDILSIYGWSALRMPALLVLLIPGIRTIVDVLGDVLFHIQPDGSKLSSRQYTRERLRMLLTQLRNREPNLALVVVAHSQGSVISWSLLHEEGRLADLLITMGSPLSTIYARFLGAEFQRPFTLVTQSHNLYRDGDYIGGVVNGFQKNVPIGPGVHTDYWSDEIVAIKLRDCISVQMDP